MQNNSAYIIGMAEHKGGGFQSIEEENMLWIGSKVVNRKSSIESW